MPEAQGPQSGQRPRRQRIAQGIEPHALLLGWLLLTRFGWLVPFRQCLGRCVRQLVKCGLLGAAGLHRMSDPADSEGSQKNQEDDPAELGDEHGLHDSFGQRRRRGRGG